MAQRSTPGSRPVAICVALLLLGYVLMAVAGTWAPRAGLGFTAGHQITLTASEVPEADDLDRAAEVIAERVAPIAGARVRTAGADRVIVEYPGELRPDLPGKLLEGGRFGIRIVTRGEMSSAPAPADEAVDDSGTPASGSAAAEMIELPDRDYGEPTVWTVRPDAESLEAFSSATCPVTVTAEQDHPDKPLVACIGPQKYLLSPVVVDGDQLAGAAARATTGVGDWSVRLRFTSSGTRAFSQMSRILSSTQGQFAVVLDGALVATARMPSTISGGEAVLSGNYTEESASALAERLDAGTLPLGFTAETQSPAPADSVTRTDAWILLGIFGVGVLALSLLAPSRLGRVGWALPGSIVFLGALGYPVLALLGQAVGLVISPAGLAGLLLAPLLTVLVTAPLLAAVGHGVAAGQSPKVAAQDRVRRSRVDVAWAMPVPLLLSLALVLLGRGSVAEFGLALAVAVVLAAGVHLAFTTSLVQVLAERGRSRGADQPAVPALPGGQRGRYLIVGLLALLGLLGVVLALTGAESTAVGETGAGWSVLAGVITVLVIGLVCFYRFDDLRYALAGPLAGVTGALVATGLPLLLGAGLGRDTAAVALAALVLCLVTAVTGLGEVERLVGAGGATRPSSAVATAPTRAAARLLPALVCLGLPLVATLVAASLIGAPGWLLQFTVLTLVALLLAGATPLLAALLVGDLPRPGSGRAKGRARTTGIRGSKPTQRTLQPNKRSKTASRDRARQPARAGSAKRGKK